LEKNSQIKLFDRISEIASFNVQPHFQESIVRATEDVGYQGEAVGV